MSAYFNSICHNQRDCGGKFENALFILGPFDGSDYHNPLFQGKSVDEIRTTLLPKVIDAIIDGVRRLISIGARKVMFPGLHTMFDLPIYRTAFSRKTCGECEEMTIYHNNMLEYAIEKLNKEERPDAVVFFGNYYAAFVTMETYALYEDAMDNKDMKACCGAGGRRYNEGVTACKQPQRKIHWDGMHLTQEAYKIMTKDVLYSIFDNLHCPSS